VVRERERSRARAGDLATGARHVIAGSSAGAFAFSHDGRWLVVGRDHHPGAIVVELATQRAYEIGTGELAPTTLSIADGGRALAAAGDQTLVVVDFLAGTTKTIDLPAI